MDIPGYIGGALFKKWASVCVNGFNKDGNWTLVKVYPKPIEVLGVTFDFIDIVMYGTGVLIAAFVDVKLFANFFGFWVSAKNE